MSKTIFALLLFVSACFAQISRFQHVVVIVQENRSPDNLFQGLCSPPYGTSTSCGVPPAAGQYDIQITNWLDMTSPTGVTQPAPEGLVSPYDLGHVHKAFVGQCNKNPKTGRCRMNGSATVNCTPSSLCPPHPQFGYVDNSSGILNPYLDLATQYGFANYMFQTNQGPSYPAHLYLFGGTAAPDAASDAIGTFASENGIPSNPINQGCLSPPTMLVQLIDANGTEDPGNRIYPCFEHSTLSDLLETASVTWRYYTSSPSSIWTAPNSINHICQPSGGNCTGTEWLSNVDLRPADILTDAAKCNLRQVNWVIPSGQNSDHSMGNTGGGPAWVASVVNAIGNSYANSGGACDYWGANVPGNETAIFVLWDDWGGWYDHEPPPIPTYPYSGYEQGFRVPLMTISAYTPPQYISNIHYDFGSILRFIEQNYRFTKGSLNFADARSRSDLTDMFNLLLPPRSYLTVLSNRDPDTSDNPTDPDDD